MLKMRVLGVGLGAVALVIGLAASPAPALADSVLPYATFQIDLSSNSVGAGTTMTVTVTVASVPPSAVPLTGSITVASGDVYTTDSVSGTGTVDSFDSPGLGYVGTAQFTVTPRAVGTGTHTVTAEYEGPEFYGIQSATDTFTVTPSTPVVSVSSSPDPSVTGQPVTFTASAAVGGMAVPGTFTFTLFFPSPFDSVVIGNVPTGVNGTATITQIGLAPSLLGLPPGPAQTIIVAFSPNDTSSYSTPAPTLLAQDVNPGDTTTSVSSSANPVLAGQAVTFTATVAPVAPAAGYPSGSVAFSDGGSPIGQAALSGGTASFTTSTLGPGSHVITAAYSGDANFSASAGSLPGNPQVVTSPQPPAITSPGSAAFTIGTPGSVQITATGDPAPALTETGALPAGVTFTDNGDGTATLAGTPGPGTSGSYSLNVTAGNGTAPDATQVFTLTVNGIAPAVTSQPVGQTVAAGQDATFTASASGDPSPAVQWQVSAGNGPFTDIAGATQPTLTITAATPAQDGSSYRAVFTNTAGTAVTGAATLTVINITLQPSALPAATATVAYSAVLAATGGFGPYTFAVTAGALPPGLALSPGGQLSGTPATVGSWSFAITAVDTRGYSGTAGYTLTVASPYVWSGILPPVNADGTSIFKLGSTVPVKFQLTDTSGQPVTNAQAWLYYAQVSNVVAGTDMEAVSTSAATTGNAFRYDPTAGQYIFNWGTKGLSVGTYDLVIVLGDGSRHMVQVSLR